ncbi:hypothetical protein GE09DRAFT_471906 [Coniochaeta sp. 2T2.1]|nr:hypothetical protein GE09DRAFT_471906 [Coniochaeta sp. 2T2.1]
MATPAIAVPAQVNGSTTSNPPLSRSHSPMSIASSTKRKRDDGDTAPPDAEQRQASTGADSKSAAVVNGATQKPRDQKLLIRDYFHLLQRYDSDAAVLKQPLSDDARDNAEPEAKRRKADDEGASTSSPSIEAKVLQDGYATLEDILFDVTRAAKASIASLKSSSSEGADSDKTADLVTKVTELKNKAQDLYRRELAYPSTEQLQSSGADGDDVSRLFGGRALLMAYAATNNGKKPVLTSLQKPVDGDDADVKTFREITGAGLPDGVKVTHALRGSAIPEKVTRSRTLGELFPSPRNLPPLQPPKPNKSATKSNVLTFYHPVLTDQSSFRTGTYFSQAVTTGQWLDYSNATPATHKKTKQRERAQSLAGVKPSSTELEMSEMEALFRGAFSSFAPCKDDTAAVVSSGQVSRMYWQRYGRRNLQRLIESEVQADETEVAEDAAIDPALQNNLPEVDEDLIKEVIDTWDDVAIDPSLSDVMGHKTEEEKEVEDVLQEVSDLIETLASYQRNRNLTLPTSQDRFSADPPNGDMLRNGALSHQPSEEEMLTYQALKAQLALIIKTLPPFAVARINSDKLEELSVSTKIEIRTDDFKGVMEEDERGLRARQAQAQAATPAQRPAAHRTPSIPGSVPYTGHHQYGGQLGASSRTPMPTPQHYPQTPARAQQPLPYQRPTSAVPLPYPHQQQVRHPQAPPQPYRAPNGYPAMTPQVPKPQPPYGGYNGTAMSGQPRPQPPPGYPSAQPSASPNHRYQQPYPAAGYPQQHPQHPGQQSMHPPQHPALPQQHPQQRPYSPYVNGAGHMPQRTMSPQVPGVQPHAYSQSPTPPQQHQQLNRAPYGTPNQGIPHSPRNYNGATPGIPPPSLNRQSSGGVPGYAPVVGDVQQQARQQAHSQQQAQAAQQAQARLDAQYRASNFGHDAQSGGNKVSGLAGIGLSGNMDIQRMAAMRAASMGHGNSLSQSPKAAGAQPVRNEVPAGNGLNGGAVLPPPVASAVSPPGSNATPAAGGASPMP